MRWFWFRLCTIALLILSLSDLCAAKQPLFPYRSAYTEVANCQLPGYRDGVTDDERFDRGVDPACPSAPARNTDCALTVVSIAIPFLLVAAIAGIILNAHRSRTEKCRCSTSDNL